MTLLPAVPHRDSGGKALDRRARTPAEIPLEVVAAMRVYLDRSPVQVTRATLLPWCANNTGTSELYVSSDGQESNRVQLAMEP